MSLSRASLIMILFCVEVLFKLIKVQFGGVSLGRSMARSYAYGYLGDEAPPHLSLSAILALRLHPEALKHSHVRSLIEMLRFHAKAFFFVSRT
jgi:hypothetical protein